MEDVILILEIVSISLLISVAVLIHVGFKMLCKFLTEYIRTQLQDKRGGKQ